MEETKKYISLQELQTHNKKDDLWISILGKIYNVTSWVNNHPGGELPLLYFAGQDVTDVFLAYHPKSSWMFLDKFFTGCFLKDYKVSEISKDYRNLHSEFQKMGLFDSKGHSMLITMVAIVLMFSLSVYGVIFSNSFWVHFLSSFLLGYSWCQSGWVGHDTAHYQAMANPTWNRIMQSVFGNCHTGVGASWWKWTHNAHHIACNALEFDPDTQLMPLLAVSSKAFESLTSHFYEEKMNFDAITRFLISYQHLTFYPILAFYRVLMCIFSVALVLSSRKVPHRKLEFLGLLVFWVWYPLLVSCLPNWYERIIFVVISIGMTGIQHFQFSLNHIPCDVYRGRPEGNDWFEKQTIGSLDIECPPWMDWFHGGLQFQIEHHLFPRMPRCNFRKISQYVKRICKKHDLPYKSTTFWKANALTYGTLKAAALEARKCTNSNPRNLVWEALTSVG